MDNYSAYNTTAAALLLLTGIPSVVIFFCSLCLARRHSDPARTWLSFYRPAFVFYCMGIVFIFFNYLLAVLYRELYSYTDGLVHILRAQYQTSILGSFFDELSIIGILLALVSLGKAAKLIHTGKASSLDRVVQWVSYGVAGLLAILNIVYLALSEKQYANQYSSGSSRSVNVDPKMLQDLRQVTFAMLVIQMIFNIFVLVRSIIVAVSTRTEPRVTTATRYLIVCCVLMLMKTCYSVGYYAEWVPLGNTSNVNVSKIPGPYFAILDVVFNFWPAFITLVILFALGRKKQYGVWATEQPFMMVRPHGMPPQPTPWGFEYSTPPNQPVPQTWQQQQPAGPIPPAYTNPHELPPQHAALHAPQFRHELSPQQHWTEPVSPHPHRSYERSVQTGAISPPPPSHYETMGLNHQADGTPPQASPAPYNEKK
ncbi:methyltransferase type 12 [Purpureocillium lavendulum]|uniref:Methyltransferase type 12 n=1 Tax=Purpureocillium lavendulum TaxID=1247861 RepID=A0AB34FL01_9HYPO|nr:methyltransferase type 12 [Purpureocillium lavendulum]